jgi:hypothetical protein
LPQNIQSSVACETVGNVFDNFGFREDFKTKLKSLTLISFINYEINEQVVLKGFFYVGVCLDLAQNFVDFESSRTNHRHPF